MKKLFLILALLFCLIAIVFTVLPTGTFALLPIVPALLFSFLTFRKSEGKMFHASRLILFVSAAMLLIVIAKEVLIQDEVVADKQFEQKKIESEKETVKELEELEGLE